jgi:hypothetical protein
LLLNFPEASGGLKRPWFSVSITRQAPEAT